MAYVRPDFPSESSARWFRSNSSIVYGTYNFPWAPCSTVNASFVISRKFAEIFRNSFGTIFMGDFHLLRIFHLVVWRYHRLIEGRNETRADRASRSNRLVWRQRLMGGVTSLIERSWSIRLQPFRTTSVSDPFKKHERHTTVVHRYQATVAAWYEQNSVY